jgi:hypothetical protein
MKRTLSLLIVLLPLSAWAAAPTAKTDADKAANDPPHAWPPLATATSPVRATPTFSAFPPRSLVTQAVKQMEGIWRNPSPKMSVPSLAHLNLTPHVRLALVTRPEVTTNVLGASTSNVGLLSLQW